MESQGGSAPSSGRHRERAAELERQLAAAQQIAHIGSWAWDVASGHVSWSDELYRIYGLEPQSVEITFETFLARLHPEDRARTQEAVGVALREGVRFEYPERIVRPDGSIRELITIGEVDRTPDGAPRGLIGTCRDVTEERERERALARAHALQADEQRVLEMIASGAPLTTTLDALIRAIEAHAPPTLGSILTLDGGGRTVRHIAAPSIPDGYVRAIDGNAIGPRAGSCGTAAYLRKPVFVSDIATDERWEAWREIALRHELRACWSTPLIATDGRLLGTFALYYRTPRAPTQAEIELVGRVGHLAGIAIERRQLEDQLRALAAHVETIREEERTGIAREIHDELGQALTALRMDVAWIERRTSAGAPLVDLREKLGGMAQLIDGVVEQVRRISAELRPGVLDDLGLVAAVEWQAQEFQERTGTTCVVDAAAEAGSVGRDLATVVFRTFQEALTNVARHAEARTVDVALSTEGDWLRLVVRDDGKGIDPRDAMSPESLGLLGMRERARRVGGTATVAPGDAGGTVVTLHVPLAAAPRAEVTS